MDLKDTNQVAVKNAAIYYFTFCMTIIILNFAYWHCVRPSVSLVSLFYVWLFEFFALGIAFECTELVLLIVLPEKPLPFLQELKSHAKTALLYVTCDDYDLELIQELCNQTYPSLDIYVLDDSKKPLSQQLIAHLPVTLVRRKSRRWFKAGNLNNWLLSHGEEYKYFVVADADSKFPPEFILSMVKYAEHPKNRNIAIFESLISNWNKESKFANFQNTFRPLIHRLSLRVENALGQNLSVGHNNLYRTSNILSGGGFSTEFVAEDYATTLKLVSRAGGLCRTVPILSFEREPINLNEFVARQARWAISSFQLSSINVSSLSWLLRLRLLKTIYVYSTQLVWFPALMLFCLFALNGLWALRGFENIPKQVTTFNSFHAFWLSYSIVPLLLRSGAAFLCGVSFRKYLVGSFFSSCLFISALWPLFKKVVTALILKTVEFDPTGRRQKANVASVFSMTGPTWTLHLVSLILVIFLPRFMYINFLWIFPALFAPIITFVLQSESEGLSGNGKDH